MTRLQPHKPRHKPISIFTYHRNHHDPIIPPSSLLHLHANPYPQRNNDETKHQQRDRHNGQLRPLILRVDEVGLWPRCDHVWWGVPHSAGLEIQDELADGEGEGNGCSALNEFT